MRTNTFYIQYILKAGICSDCLLSVLHVCYDVSLGYSGKISQMPIILTPLHFDRDPLQKQPSCRRSVVIRTFITSDFMTGVPATPGSHIPEEVRGRPPAPPAGSPC